MGPALSFAGALLLALMLGASHLGDGLLRATFEIVIPALLAGLVAARLGVADGAWLARMPHYASDALREAPRRAVRAAAVLSACLGLRPIAPVYARLKLRIGGPRRQADLITAMIATPGVAPLETHEEGLLAHVLFEKDAEAQLESIQSGAEMER
jgi:hypothetical protein